MSRLKNHAGLLLVLGSVAIIYCFLPLGTAFEIGNDEGFELIKAFLCSKGFKLYTEIWNDQPPVSTMILKTAFAWLGTSILTARLVAAGFGLLLTGSFYELVRLRSDKWTAAIATFFLVAAPGVLLLSVSVMLEVPAFATALVSAWVLARWADSARNGDSTNSALKPDRNYSVGETSSPSPRPSPPGEGDAPRLRFLRSPFSLFPLIASGAVMAVALQIKLTAVLVVPAILAELWLGTTWGTESSPLRKRFNEWRGKSGASFPRPSPRPRPMIGSRTGQEGREIACASCGQGISAVLLKTAIWGMSLATVFALIGFTWGKGALASSWKSHTGSQVVPGMDRPQDHKFDPRLVWQYAECFCAAAVGIALVMRRGSRQGMDQAPRTRSGGTRKKNRVERVPTENRSLLTSAATNGEWRNYAFPLVLLVTAVGIHSVHRPWWNYYFLHFAIPVAWLAGVAVRSALRHILALHAKHGFELKAPGGKKLIFLCVLVAAVIARSERRLEGNVRIIRARPSADENPIVKAMRARAGNAKWVYSEDGSYPFHAKLLVPPEVAIVMPKRFWSGQATTESIMEACKTHQVGMVVLPVGSFSGAWRTFLEREYFLVCRDEREVLYARKNLPAPEIPNRAAAGMESNTKFRP